MTKILLSASALVFFLGVEFFEEHPQPIEGTVYVSSCYYKNVNPPVAACAAHNAIACTPETGSEIVTCDVGYSHTATVDGGCKVGFSVNKSSCSTTNERTGKDRIPIFNPYNETGSYNNLDKPCPERTTKICKNSPIAATTEECRHIIGTTSGGTRIVIVGSYPVDEGMTCEDDPTAEEGSESCSPGDPEYTTVTTEGC